MEMDRGSANFGMPSWDRLYEIAASQEGHFTTAQAGEAGYSPQLLAKYLRSGRILRVYRGIYRLVHFPPGDHEDLVVVWLWSGREGVFSHETALALHRLSDVLPSRVHLSVPPIWKRRRRRLPPGVLLHYAGVGDTDRVWIGGIQATSAGRTVIDCAEGRMSPEFVGQALDEGLRRGLFTAPMVEPATEYVRSFGSGAE